MVLCLDAWRVANDVIMHFLDSTASQKGAESDMGILLVADQLSILVPVLIFKDF